MGAVASVVPANEDSLFNKVQRSGKKSKRVITVGTPPTDVDVEADPNSEDENENSTKQKKKHHRRNKKADKYVMPLEKEVGTIHEDGPATAAPSSSPELLPPHQLPHQQQLQQFQLQLQLMQIQKEQQQQQLAWVQRQNPMYLQQAAHRRRGSINNKETRYKNGLLATTASAHNLNAFPVLSSTTNAAGGVSTSDASPPEELPHHQIGRDEEGDGKSSVALPSILQSGSITRRRSTADSASIALVTHTAATGGDTEEKNRSPSPFCNDVPFATHSNMGSRRSSTISILDINSSTNNNNNLVNHRHASTASMNAFPAERVGVATAVLTSTEHVQGHKTASEKENPKQLTGSFTQADLQRKTSMMSTKNPATLLPPLLPSLQSAMTSNGQSSSNSSSHVVSASTNNTVDGALVNNSPGDDNGWSSKPRLRGRMVSFTGVVRV